MPSPHNRLALCVLLLALSACKRAPAGDASSQTPVDCQEDFGCFISRARTCAPASVLRREQVEISGTQVRTVTRHEVVGLVRGRCHVRRTRLEPPPLPIREVQDPYLPTSRPVEEPTAEQTVLDERIPPRLQCLYRQSQAADALQRFVGGHPTAEDLEPCYPGDGRCGPVPLLSPPCALGPCLLGRWTYSCEANRGREIYECEGTRLSDTSHVPGELCASWCSADGQEKLDCHKLLHPFHRAHEEGPSP